MKRFLFRVALVLVALAPAVAVLADLPPIIDRELFFGDPEISGSQISPDGQYISFIKPYKDVRNVWVKGREEPFDAARPVTADERPVPAYFWSQDSRYILYVQDKGGNENYHVYAVDPAAEAEAATGVPPARDLTPLEKVRALIYAVPENTPGTIIVGLNDRDATYHDIYKVDIATGKRDLVLENTQKVGFWIFDRDGKLRLAFRQKEDGGNEILRVDGSDLVQIYSVTYLESATPVGFSRDQKKIYLESNKGDDVDLSQLLILDPRTGKTEFVESDPEKQVDFGRALFSDATDELIATYYVGDRSRIYAKNKETKRDLELIRKKLPDGEIRVGSTSEDMRYWIVVISRDVDPGSVYLYDRKEKDFDLLYRSRSDLPSEHLAEMKPIRYQARDGMEIPAYLTLPKGIPAKNLPVVLHPHGGPWSRDTWGYDSYAQFLANRGYAVLQPNFRSSSGYGKRFLNAGNHQWGTGAMQHDLTDGVKYLIQEGIADPKRVAIFGGSYGGYATLAGVTFTPDVYACGVPYVAPSNLITLIESFPAYWRPFLKGSWYLRVGDPEVEGDRADLIARSPLFKVDQIRVPLLVVHGANDPRVKQAESDGIVVALREKGKPVEYLVAPDEGHGFRSPENRMSLAVAMEKFFAKHLGGRAQKDVPVELAQHLDSITVDVASVKLPGKEEEALLAAARTGPLPVPDGGKIEPGTFNYSTTIAMGERTIDLKVSRAIESAEVGGRKCWNIVSTAETPMGTQTDVYLVDARTLEPLKREVNGMGTLQLTYSPTAINGEMGQAGQTVDINETLDAPVMADGPGLEVALAALPLAEGYTTTLRYFEPLTQKVRPVKLTVTGTATTKVAGGSFPTLVVELSPLDGDESGSGTLHVMAEAPHHVVKSEYKLPAMMGGGKRVSELASLSGSK